MATKNSSPLREKDEILLSRYFDGECSFISRFFALQLLKRNPEAQQFYNRLYTVQSLCEEHQTGLPSASECNLWDNIEKRIATEERLARYEAESSHQHALIGLRSLFCPQTFVGAVSGAGVAALLLTVVAPGGTGSPSRDSHRGGVEFARLQVANDRGGRPRAAIVPNIIPERDNSGLHELVAWNNATGSYGPDENRYATGSANVDWLKANGPLALLENPGSSSSIIWVKRRPSGFPSGLRGTVPVRPTAFSQPERDESTSLFDGMK